MPQLPGGDLKEHGLPQLGRRDGRVRAAQRVSGIIADHLRASRSLFIIVFTVLRQGVRQQVAGSPRAERMRRTAHSLQIFAHRLPVEGTDA